MTGNINKNPVADIPTAQPGKEKKPRSKFSAQASKRIENLFSDLDQEPLLPLEELPGLEQEAIPSLDALLSELEAAQEYRPPEMLVPPATAAAGDGQEADIVAIEEPVLPQPEEIVPPVCSGARATHPTGCCRA